MNWTESDIPNQENRTAIVTGANAGIGFETARILAEKGSHVILACRNQAKGEEAVERIRTKHPSASVELEILDLASLESVEKFAKQVESKISAVDLLVNNAGVMIPPESMTEDGFELQFGVNYLGHFALTGLLLSTLKKSDQARVVTLSSIAHRTGSIDFGSFRGGKRYRAWKSYEQSKLACLMFAIELDERLRAGGVPVMSMAAHPGGTKTDLQRHNRFFDWATDKVAMRATQGALPTLYAATSSEAEGGKYYGPNGFMEMRGYPAVAKVSRKAQDAVVRKRLWDVSSELSHIEYLM